VEGGNGEREWEAAGTGRESQESMQKVPSKLHLFI